MPTTPNMLLDLPTLNADPGVWDDKLNAAATLIDSHDHSTNKGVKITPSGLNINADLTFGGVAKVTNVKGIDFSALGVGATGVNKSIFVKSDNELYWRTNAGVDVKITSGGSLNLSLVGGIYGDYSTTSAKVYYEDAGKRYKMLQSGPAPDFWASVDCGDLKLYEKASGITNAVTIKSPAALAAGYTVTWPAALPGSAQLLQISSAGALSFSNSNLNALTLAANQNITISGTGDIKHGDRILYLHPFSGSFKTADWTRNSNGYVVSTALSDWFCSIPLKEGDRIKSVTVSRYGDAAADVDVVVYKMAPNGTQTQLGITNVVNPAAAWADTTVDVTDTTLASGECIYIVFSCNAANIRIGTIRVTYDRP